MKKRIWVALLLSVVVVVGSGFLLRAKLFGDIWASGINSGNYALDTENTNHSSGDKNDISIVFAGDVMMDDSVKEAMRERGVDDPFLQVKDQVQAADWAVVNLETAVTTATVKDTSQTYNFNADPASLGGLRNAGFDMVSLANNHVLDYLPEGLMDTIRNLEDVGLAHTGAGKNEEEAFQAKTVILGGNRVKIAAFTRFIPLVSWNAAKDRPGVAGAYKQKKVLKVIREQSADSDYFIVYMHWGVEQNNRPEKWQRDLAKKMIDAGADAIIGSHPHVLQGFEYYKGKPIAYSIGNFLFPDYVAGPNADTGLLKLSLHDGRIDMGFYPYYIEDNRILKLYSDYEEKQLKYIESLSYGVYLDGNVVKQK
ncbi:CapA family protein [Paenibacillus terrigena]|uniref:CapA family protein n=1 Tax=Paenibacillus terrigena TaxID=369333 RepID=UPI0028D19C32|nr:CapA family protein [Paenibacillus terrigena]